MEKKGLCMCFNFQIAFRKECQGVTVFGACTSFLNTSYLFRSYYCNARFAYIRNPKNITGTGAVVTGRKAGQESGLVEFRGPCIPCTYT